MKNVYSKQVKQSEFICIFSTFPVSCCYYFDDFTFAVKQTRIKANNPKNKSDMWFISFDQVFYEF